MHRWGKALVALAFALFVALPPFFRSLHPAFYEGEPFQIPYGLPYVLYVAGFLVPTALSLRGRRTLAVAAASALLLLPMLTFFYGLQAWLPGGMILLAVALPDRPSHRNRVPGPTGHRA
jgi:hypothetical protein